MEIMKKAELVLIPSPGLGHLVPTVEFAKLLMSRDEHISITVIILKLPFDSKVDIYTKSLFATSNPGLKFVDISQDESFLQSRSKNTFFFDFIDTHKIKVREFLAEISNNSASTQLCGVILDMFCSSMIDVVNEFDVPSYVFYTSGAAQLGLVLHLQSLRDNFNQDLTNYTESDFEFAVPTFINSVPAKVLPSVIFDKEGGCKAFLDLTKRYREAKGVIVNTFLELEFHAVQALCNDKTIAKIYTAGPILNLKDSKGENGETEMILEWLDLQPNSSVLFLCFGTKGYFDEEQAKEIAYALERSGYRFLWSLRGPPAKGKMAIPGEYESSAEEVLPEGFLQRTAGIGKVIGWAPQMAVLSHPAVGGFVSHCGWNSTLESLWCGVPMAAWPQYAEQQTNAFQIVKDMELAVEIKMDYRNDFRMSSKHVVSADVIEDRIRQLMDPGNEIRNKVKEMKEKSKFALKEGGSSFASLGCFLENVKKHIS